MKKKTETSEAIAFIDWCDRHPVIKGLMVHIPNERKCSPQYGKQLKRMGVRAGFPDFFLPFSFGSYDGLFIELKRDQRSKLTRAQQEWIIKLKCRYKADVAYGADHAIEIVKEYLG
jgi:hypothetical protein